MIRVLSPDYAPETVRIWREAIAISGPRMFGADQLAACTARVRTPDVMAHEMAERHVLGWEEDGALVGFAELKPDGHVDRVYVTRAGRGIGTALVRTLIETVRERNLAELHTEASDLARPVFARLGFTHEGRREVDLDGVPLHNHAMRMRV